MPGEAAWPTQPFPVKTAAARPHHVRSGEGLLHADPRARGLLQGPVGRRTGSIRRASFTPAGIDGYMVTFPAHAWRRQLERPLVRSVARLRLHQRDEHRAGRRRCSRAPIAADDSSWLRATPWGGPVGRFWNPANKIPCSAPPFGELVAVNVNTGEIAWKVPLGFIEELKSAGLRQHRRAEHRRQHRHRVRPALRRRHERRALPRVRFEDRQAAVGDELEASAHALPMTFSARTAGSTSSSPPAAAAIWDRRSGTKLVAFALPAKARTSPRRPRPARTSGGPGRRTPQARARMGRRA